MWLTELLHGKAEIRPVRPEAKKSSGRLENLDSVGLSSPSSLSSAKNCNAQTFEAWKPLPMLWTPSVHKGRPCCWLPVPLPERLRGLGLEDLQGFGVPAEGLPSTLRPFSRNGWRLRLDATGAIEMVAGPRARRDDGCRAYLDAMRDSVAEALRTWQAAPQGHEL